MHIKKIHFTPKKISVRLRKETQNMVHDRQYLEAVRFSATTSSLELSTFGANIRLDTIVCVWVVDGGGVSKVAHRLSGILGTSQQHGVGALRCPECKLVECDALTAGLGNTSSNV